MVSNCAICELLELGLVLDLHVRERLEHVADGTPSVLGRLPLAHAHTDERVDLVGVVLLVRGQREDVVGADRLVLVVDAQDRHLLWPGALELHGDLVADLAFRSVAVSSKSEHAAVGERVEVGVGPQVDGDRFLEVLGRGDQLLLVAVGQLEEA